MYNPVKISLGYVCGCVCAHLYVCVCVQLTTNSLAALGLTVLAENSHQVGA